MNRRLSLLLVPLVAAYVLFPRATPRPAAPVQVPVSPGQQVAPATEQRTGAPQPVEPTVGSTLGVVAEPTTGDPGGAPTPRPSGGIGQPASYCKPGYCETPKPPQKPIIPSSGGVSGEATWWNSFGSGIYTALRPDLGSKGDLVIVCGGRPFHCVTAPVITSCACLGPHSDRLVDLSRDLFREFADPSQGVVRITLQVVGR